MSDLSTSNTSLKSLVTLPPSGNLSDAGIAESVAGDTSAAHSSSLDSSLQPDRPYRLPSMVRPPVMVGASSKFLPLQQWEGWVVEIDRNEGVFRAILKDLEKGGNPNNETVEFPIEEVESDDAELFDVGAVFRWIIGYRDQKLGKRERVSSLYFRRRPNLSDQDLRDIEERAERLANAFGGNGDQYHPRP